MKIAIHHRSGGFSERWIRYCENNRIDYKIVNAYDSNIVEQVSDCDAFMWHHQHIVMADTLFAKQLIYSLGTAGIRCFPDFKTTWHFDDKVGQKYLLEAIGAPLVPSYVFYSRKKALEWVEKTNYPKVFKLRGGAGSSNVMLVHNKRQAKKLVKKAFGKGFSQSSIRNLVSENMRKYKERKISFFTVIKSIVAYYLKPDTFNKNHQPEKGYAYFQDFIPNNSYDIRICVVGDHAFALKRLVRKDDFRASGSGSIIYDKGQIDERCVKLAFEMNKKLKAQSVAFDFVFDKENNPLVVEISYGYAVAAYDKCEGWWDMDLNWHPGENFDFCGWMVEELIQN